ncbi:hypothetical protein A2803_03075 [Candidatus Woesebacteria bacterium RIFCSPHIGHO2_01_FULL_44_21]|uniref:Uncharacterized protein n=1 Tax=Candidatus Woesebacteria bacterium RIFCSPHIGHO2_01_FULL_44_21 TaxID=1802503 RepID=A0A1F7Z2W1_9BACT|nr:MAG: hypothetical protein A2803_03075 [Candidatus Woesebacteria bacterium RIFCSPHIGHO2_01_FULL_44_21]OGM69202.1 MAG: hypothetical protein A2897_04305 [Candidatus Woesebacteria bacterium RIFCSPLOWO2_01_FULL_44_24b]
MKDLLEYIIGSITGSTDFTVEETRPEANIVNFEVVANPDIIGLIIGREGKTIKNIRKILSIKATKEKVAVNINVSPTL